MNQKRIYMEIGDGSEFESLKTKEPKKEAQEETQDFILDAALDKLFNGLEVLEITGGVAHVAMPLSMLKILSKFSELLNINEKEIER